MRRSTSQFGSQSGFTLMEILVSTVIFVITVSLMLSLFNYTLKINRRVQSLRQVAQGTRNFTEFIAREVRNGEIDYSPPDTTNCTGNYSSVTNDTLALINVSGEHVCFYHDSNTELLHMTKISPSGALLEEVVNPTNFLVKRPFRFVVRPISDPSGKQGIQPFVTIMSVFEVKLGPNEPSITIPYQTTISTDVYDTPSAN
jgi:prepilin-type N-terminal cleavage/methylation domain-containing protein